jgi:hypothetical protein
MDLILPIPDTCEKMREVIEFIQFGEKPLSVFQNSFWFSTKRSLKWTSKTGQKAVFGGGRVNFGGGRVVFGPLGW